MTVDWSLYERPCYTIAEIVHYWCELPDQKNLHIDSRTRLPLANPDYPMIEVRTNILIDAIESRQLPHEAARDASARYIRGEGLQWRHKVVRRDALKFWFERYRTERPPFLFWDEISEEETPSSWPFTHNTKLLEMVRWVIQQYWENTAPELWPTKELVVEKLKDLHGLTQNEAEAVDLVTRHDSKRRSSLQVPPRKTSKHKG